MSTNPLSTPLINLEQIHKTYRVGPVTVPVLQDLTLRIWQGEFVAITGPSGSGKSTLLNLLGLLDVPDSGSFRLDGRDIATLDDNACTLLRSRKIGFVFQAGSMLPRLTAAENVAVPLLYQGVGPREADAAARAVLQRVGLPTVAGNYPSQLSVGQRQRVAVARALVTKPRLILADEPTAALDAENAAAVLQLLREFNREHHTTVVLITHHLADAENTPRHLVLAGGRLQSAPVLVPS